MKQRGKQVGKPGRKPGVAVVAKRLIDEFGAEFAVNLLPRPELPRSRVLIDVSKVNRKLSEFDNEAVPYEFPLDPPSVVALWPRAYSKGSQGRVVLRRVLGAGGLDERQVAHVWCLPREGKGAVLAQDIAKYWIHAVSAIFAANPTHVILIGSPAVSMWRRDLKVMQVNGHTYTWRNRFIVVPIMSPLSVLADRRNLDEWRRGVNDFLMHYNEGNFQLRNICVECNQQAASYDRDAVPYCQHHLNHMNRSQRGHDEWTELANQSLQERLI